MPNAAIAIPATVGPSRTPIVAEPWIKAFAPARSARATSSGTAVDSAGPATVPTSESTSTSR